MIGACGAMMLSLSQPKYLFPLLEKQSANLRRYHPKASMWVSPQVSLRVQAKPPRAGSKISAGPWNCRAGEPVRRSFTESRLFVTSQAQEGGKKSLLTLCYLQDTGKELWRHDFGLGVDQRTNERSNLAVTGANESADTYGMLVCDHFDHFDPCDNHSAFSWRIET